MSKIRCSSPDDGHGHSTDSDNLPIKVGKLLDTWIEMKDQVDNNGIESFVRGESLMNKLIPRSKPQTRDGAIKSSDLPKHP